MVTLNCECHTEFSIIENKLFIGTVKIDNILLIDYWVVATDYLCQFYERVDERKHENQIRQCSTHNSVDLSFTAHVESRNILAKQIYTLENIDPPRLASLFGWWFRFAHDRNFSCHLDGRFN